MNVTMLTYGIMTNAFQNEWNILGSWMSPLRPQAHPGVYKRQEDYLYAGFKDFPLRPHDYEAVGGFIFQRRPEGAFATSIIPLIFIGWIGVFGTLIPKDSGEKLRSAANIFSVNNLKFSFLVTVTLALVFLTLEIDKKLASSGEFRRPIIYNVIIASYGILLPNFGLLRDHRADLDLRCIVETMKLSPLIPGETLWATSKDRNKPTGNIVNSILILMDKCSKVEALDLNEPKNPQRWDRFESILQNFIFVIQVISLFAIHGN